MLQSTFARKKLRAHKLGKYLLVCLSIFLLNIVWPLDLFSQSLLLEKSTLSFDALNDEQTERLDHLQSQGIYSNYTLMEIHLNALEDDAGLVNTELDNFFDAMAFKSFLVNYESDSNFSWSGKFSPPVDTFEYNDGALTLVAIQGIISGTMQSENRSFQIIDLSGGLYVLAEFDLSVYSPERCQGTSSNEEFIPISGTICGHQKTRILFIYTQNGLNLAGSGYQPLAYAAVADLNVIWANSQVNNTAEVAGVMILPSLNESPDNTYDLDAWSVNSTVTLWRNELKADIVVFMTHQYPPGQAFGRAKSKSGLFADAFMLVVANLAVTGNHIFAHEANHLYGADHQVGLASTTVPYAHGQNFKTGALLGMFGTWRYTNMYTTNGSTNIQHLSNPNVTFNNKATGTSGSENNARKVREAKDQIANHYNDLVPYSASIEISGHGKCQNTGTATAVVACGTAPFTYQWSYSDNGLAYGIIPGSTSSINTTVPIQYATFSGTYGSRMYSVKVTDALGNVTYASLPIEYYCPPVFDWEPLSTRITLKHSSEVYPNPNSGNFQIWLNIAEEQAIELTLFNINGQVMTSVFRGELSAGVHKLNHDRKEQMAPGTYLLSIKGQSINAIKKVYIQ